MKVRLTIMSHPHSGGSNPCKLIKTVTMAARPMEGETLTIGGGCFKVGFVLWRGRSNVELWLYPSMELHTSDWGQLRKMGWVDYAVEEQCSGGLW